VRNSKYGGEPPQLAAIVYRAYPRAEDVFSAYQKGELDAIPAFAGLKEQVARDPELRAQLKSYALSSTNFLVLNTRRPGLGDPRVRQALGMALERRTLLDTVLQQPGESASSLHPPGIAGRDPALWPTENVDRAKQLLADAGYPDGKGFPTLVYAVFTQDDPLAQYVVKRWQDTLGIRVQVGLVQGSDEAFRHSKEWEEKADVYYGGWNSDYVDASNWFNLLWDSANDPGQYNCGWKNAEFDRLVRAAQSEQDEAKRTELYHRAEALMARDYPIVPLYHPTQQYLVKPYVRGFGPGQTGVAPPLSRVKISK
jgi:oligopeptide transport system substrate-binding protein